MDQVDYLDVLIKQEKHGWHCELYDKKDAMPGHAGRRRARNIGTELLIARNIGTELLIARNIGTELSGQCNYWC